MFDIDKMRAIRKERGISQQRLSGVPLLFGIMVNFL